MNVEEIRDYCVSKFGVEECFPFDNETLVFKVGGKIFLLMGINANPIQFNVKCEPQKAIDLREKYSFVLPGYHMNKAHWNTIVCDGRATKKFVFECIFKIALILIARHIKVCLSKDCLCSIFSNRMLTRITIFFF